MKIPDYTRAVAEARQNFIDTIAGITNAQASFKPDENTWSIVDNIEPGVGRDRLAARRHVACPGGRQEQQAHLAGRASSRRKEDSPNHRRNLERKEEVVPETAKPRWGGPIEFWIHAFLNCQTLLGRHSAWRLKDTTSPKIINPTYFRAIIASRFDFLKFHIEGIRNEVEALMRHERFPSRVETST